MYVKDVTPNHLCVEDVSIVYGATGKDAHPTLAVEGADLTMGQGEFVVIVGPSGCGKTTLLNAVAGFLPIASGRLPSAGDPITGPSPTRAMVFQEPSLLPWRTVLRNVSYGLDL